MPNLTYWLAGGYILWLLVSGQYKGMIKLVTDPAWKTGSSSKAKPETLSGGKKVTQITPKEAKTGVKS